MSTGSLIDDVVHYWEWKRGDRDMPARADLDPSDLKPLLPHLLLVDVARDPLNFRYRLIGSEIDRHSAEPQTGKWITDIPGRAPPSAVWDNLEEVATSGVPSDRSVPYVGPLREFLTTRQVTLPLSDDGRLVNMLLIAVHYIRKADEAAAG